MYDPWFSGGVLNYYYGGYTLLLAPARLLATSPTLVLNIAPAVFAACAAGAAYSVGAAVAAVGRRSANRKVNVEWAAIGSAFAVLALANMAVFGEFLRWRSDGGAFDWWALSRVIPDSGAITEFPAWSLLFTDLHPHLIDVCVLLTVGVVAVALHHNLVDDRTRVSMLAAATAGMLVGMVRATNTWDLPLAAGSMILALLLAALCGARRRSVIGAGAIIVAMVVIVWSPYTRRGLVFDSGVDRNIQSTPLSSWLAQFGLFAAVSVFVLVSVVARISTSSPRAWRRIRFAPLLTAGLVLVGVGIVLLSPDAAVVVVTAGLAGSMTWLLTLRRNSAPPRRYSRDGDRVGDPDGRRARHRAERRGPPEHRLQVLVRVVDASRCRFSRRSRRRAAGLANGAAARRQSPGRPARVRCRRSRGSPSSLSAIFWATATPVRLSDRISDGGLSLDGEAYLVPDLEIVSNGETIFPADDVVLIDWLRSNVSGVHVIAEAPGVDYQWSSRVSWMTGLPTPLGWQYHQSQQRRIYGDAIERRATDLRELYSTSDQSAMARILDDQRVEYVVFGTVERAMSTPSSAAALAEFDCLRVETRVDDLFVASVDQECVSERRPRG